MRFNINHLIIATLASAFLIGCGSSSSDSVASVDTGTGYYLDSVVQGADYICGTQKGVTDEEGKFTFEKGKECTFELAGIKLRTLAADELFDNVKVVETNASVAALLQTVDADGDPSNGITIRNEFKEAIKEMVQTGAINVNAPIDETVLTEINTVLENTYPDLYDGRVVTEEEALEHINDTLESVVKELLAGKTLYTSIEGESGTLESFSFNADFTTMTWQELIGGSCSGSGSLVIDGSDIVYTAEQDSCDAEDVGISTTIRVVEMKSDYIVVAITDNEGTFLSDRLYFDEDKAKEYFLNSTSSATDTITDLTPLLAGKTFYVVGLSMDTEDNATVGSIEMSTVSFNDDLTKLTDTYADGSTEEANISVEGNKIIFLDDNSYSVVTQKDGYLYAEDFNADGTKDYESPIGHRLYENESDAQAYVEDLQNGDYMRGLIEGKTFYYIDTYDDNALETVTFTADGNVSIVDASSGDEISSDLYYSIVNDYTISLISVIDEESSATESHNLVAIEVNDDYIIFSDNSDREPLKLYYEAPTSE